MHIARDYRVLATGFVPGFACLEKQIREFICRDVRSSHTSSGRIGRDRRKSDSCVSKRAVGTLSGECLVA